MKAILQIPEPKYKSKLEAAYAKHLDMLIGAGEVLRWVYEAPTLPLGGGARYTPDFYVVVPLRLGAKSFAADSDGTCRVELHEAKGRWREAAKVRFKVAADLYPEYEWRVVTAKTTGKNHATAQIVLPSLKVLTPAEAFARKRKGVLPHQRQ